MAKAPVQYCKQYSCHGLSILSQGVETEGSFPQSHDQFWKYKLHIGLRFIAVVENYDGTLPAGLKRTIQTHLSRKPMVIVLRKDIPHDYAVVAKLAYLLPRDTSVGRPEKIDGLRHSGVPGNLIKAPDVFDIIRTFNLPAINMVDRVIANGMAI